MTVLICLTSIALGWMLGWTNGIGWGWLRGWREVEDLYRLMGCPPLPGSRWSRRGDDDNNESRTSGGGRSARRADQPGG